MAVPKGLFEYYEKKISYLLIRDITLLVIMVVCQIAEMYQYCENVILAPDNMHVIQELCGVNIYVLSCQHTDNIVLQTVKIHLYISND